MKDDRVEGEHDNSRTRDVTRAWPIAGTQRGKSDRPRHLHLGPARAAAASRCTFPRTAVAKHDQGGPTFLQTTPRHILFVQGYDWASITSPILKESPWEPSCRCHSWPFPRWVR